MSEIDNTNNVEKGFGYIGTTFINLYSKENPIKEEGEKCYFLFNSVDNYHVQIIGLGTIIRDLFTEGLNKIYCIRLDEICENNFFLDKYVWDKEYLMITNNGNPKTIPKLTILNKRSSSAFLAANLFKIEGFFVRSTVEQIIRLRKEYTEVILDDTLKTVEDMREILTYY